jgi:hypothetical protein
MLRVSKFHIFTATALIAATLLHGAFAQADGVPTFAGLEWFSPPDAVVEQLTAEGYTTASATLNENNAISFDGTLLSQDALIIAYFNNQNELVKTSVFILTDTGAANEYPTAKSNYETMKEILTKRYGTPSDSFEFFSDPYEEGDGYEATAIAVGKGTFSTYWEKNDNGILALEIDEDVDVGVGYETKEWGEYLDEKEAVGTDDF